MTAARYRRPGFVAIPQITRRQSCLHTPRKDGEKGNLLAQRHHGRGEKKAAFAKVVRTPYPWNIERHKQKAGRALPRSPGLKRNDLLAQVVSKGVEKLPSRFLQLYNVFFASSKMELEIDMSDQLEHQCYQPVECADGDYLVNGAPVVDCPTCHYPVTAATLHHPGDTPPALLEIFSDPFAADKFSASHRCAACWSILVKRMSRDESGKRRYRVDCELCGFLTPGYVSTRFIERRTEQSLAERLEARYALRESVPWLNKKQSQGEILAELGFK
jgi:hypothetical protein